MKEVKEGEEVIIGDKKHKVVNGKLVRVDDESQLDRIERKLDEHIKEEQENTPVILPVPYPVPYNPYPTYPVYPPQNPWRPYYPYWSITTGDIWEDNNTGFTGFYLSASGQLDQDISSWGPTTTTV